MGAFHQRQFILGSGIRGALDGIGRIRRSLCGLELLIRRHAILDESLTCLEALLQLLLPYDRCNGAVDAEHLMVTRHDLACAACPAVLVDSLELDEDQRQAVHEADQIPPPVVVRDAHTLDLQFPDRQEAVVGRVPEIDHPRVRMPDLAGGVAPLHRHPTADEAVKLPVVLEERASKVDPRELLDRLLPRRLRNARVKPGQRRAQIPHQHSLAFGRAAQGSVRPERLRVVGVDALPADRLLQMLGEGLLDQPVLAVNVGDQMGFPPFLTGLLLPLRQIHNLSVL